MNKTGKDMVKIRAKCDGDVATTDADAVEQRPSIDVSRNRICFSFTCVSHLAHRSRPRAHLISHFCWRLTKQDFGEFSRVLSRRSSIAMADLRKRAGKGTDLDTETENEAANQDSDVVCIRLISNFIWRISCTIHRMRTSTPRTTRLLKRLISRLPSQQGQTKHLRYLTQPLLVYLLGKKI